MWDEHVRRVERLQSLQLLCSIMQRLRLLGTRARLDERRVQHEALRTSATRALMLTITDTARQLVRPQAHRAAYMQHLPSRGYSTHDSVTEKCLASLIRLY